MNRENGKRAIAYALKAGADHCELFFSRNRGFSLQVREGEVDVFHRDDESGYGVRLLKNGVPGFSYGVNPSLESIKKAVDDALAATAFLEPEPDQMFTEPGQAYPRLELWDENITSASFADKKALAQGMYRMAKEKAGIEKVENTVYGESNQEAAIVNSLGLDLHYARNTCYAAATVIASQNGDAETGGAYQFMRRYRQIEPDSIVEEAVADGREKLGGKKIASGDCSVLFHPKAFLDLFSVLMPSFLGDRAFKHKSLLEGKIGKKVAPEFLHLFADGLWSEGVESAPFDDEGNPCRRFKVLDGGHFNGFLYDNLYGKKAGAKSTGNGYGTFKTWPAVAFNNCYFSAGAVPLDGILSGMEKGLYIKSLMGLHTANALTGDFSLGAKGISIGEGEKKEAVAGIAIAGNVLTMLRDIIAASSEVEFYGRKAAPYILVEKLRVSGV